MSKTEQDLEITRQKVAQQKEYHVFIEGIKKETADNNIRIQWLESKKLLSELSIWYAGEAGKEKEIVKRVIDEIVNQFSLQEKQEAIYTYFKIPLPKIEVGQVENVEAKKEELNTEVTNLESIQEETKVENVSQI